MRARRYWHLWRTLPADERRARTLRVVDRLLRRRSAVRRMGLAADEPSRSALRRALNVETETLCARLRADDIRRGPLHDDLDSRAAEIAVQHPDHVRATLDSARRVLDGEIDLLGSGPHRLLRPDGGRDWHSDWKSGGRWDPDVYYTDLTVVRGDGSDVKLPWELLRCQHLLVLGQAVRLAGHALPEPDARDLRDKAARRVRAEDGSWIDENPRGLGVNWTCTMEVGIRAAVWVAALALVRGDPAIDDRFVERVVGSLWMHGRHMRGNLEHGGGLTSNHYLADVVGLYTVACALPELREAEAWRKFARRSIEVEIERQVHDDGIDFERSLPYHRLVAEMFVHAALLARGAGEPFPSPWLERLGAMLEFTAACTRDDGTVPQWGDNDDGRWLPLDGYGTARPHDHRHLLALGGGLLARPDLEAAGHGSTVEALWLLGRRDATAPDTIAGRSSRAFPDAAYHVLRDGDLHCGCPCGTVGTCGIGNHSHNDLLSVCVSAAGREWISDPGTGCYTGDPALRDRLRSTAAHATVQIGSREQNDLGRGMAGVFRLDERAHPEVLEWKSGTEGAGLVARHHGFSSGSDRWVHERSIRFDPARRAWLLQDSVTRESGDGPARDPIHSRFPLHPDVRGSLGDLVPEPLGALLDVAGGGPRQRFAVQLSSDPAAEFWVGFDLPAHSSVGIEDGLYSPRYGVTRSTGVVVATVPPATRANLFVVLWSPSAAL